MKKKPPGASVVPSGTTTKACVSSLSLSFQPEMSTVAALMLVSSTQSPTGSPFDSTSLMTIGDGRAARAARARRAAAPVAPPVPVAPPAPLAPPAPVSAAVPRTAAPAAPPVPAPPMPPPLHALGAPGVGVESTNGPVPSGQRP